MYYGEFENRELDKSKHRSRLISRLSEGRKIDASSCDIDYPDPAESMFANCYGHQEFRSRRVLR